MIPQSSPISNYLAHKSPIDDAITRVLMSGRYILGGEVECFEREFAAAMSAVWSVGVANGTDAIELALRASGVGVGDLVATVSHTAVATVAAIARVGAFPLFVDIDPSTYTMSVESLASLLALPISDNLKAIVVVHLYGQPAEMPALVALARQKGLVVIEDCAQAHAAAIGDRIVGNWGDLGCFSFYPTKNLSALGDGGAIIGNDPSIESKLRALREYGWRTRYVSEMVGINSRLDEVQAAILRVKLPYLNDDNHRRKNIAKRYNEMLGDTALTLPRTRDGYSHVFHQYVVQSRNRDELRSQLTQKGITTLVHYPVAVHRQPAFSSPRYQPVSLANTESTIENILSLPMFPELGEQQIEEIGLCISAIEARC